MRMNISTHINGLLVSNATKYLRTLLLVFGLLYSFSMTGQSSNDWTPITTIDGIEVSYQKASCDGSEVLFIKAVNKSDASVSVDLTYAFHSKVDNSLIGSGELGKMTIGQQSEVSGTCEDGFFINVNNHFSMYSEEEFALTITKTE